MGGRKLARYVLEAVVGRCAGCRIWTETNQQRFVDVKHNQLTIKTRPIISPVNGKESIHTLVCERTK
jgi:hypothetical protein